MPTYLPMKRGVHILIAYCNVVKKCPPLSSFCFGQILAKYSNTQADSEQYLSYRDFLTALPMIWTALSNGLECPVFLLTKTHRSMHLRY